MVTLSYAKEASFDRSIRERYSAVGAAGETITVDCGGGNSQKSISFTLRGNTPEKRPRNLRAVMVHYGTNVTRSPTITIISGAGPSFNTLAATLAISAAADGIFLPEETFPLMSDDVVEVIAPAGGAEVVGVTVYLDVDESI